MRKKIISMLLASTMILSMALTGCGSSESGTADTVDGTQTTGDAAEGDLTDIKMAYMILILLRRTWDLYRMRSIKSLKKK